MKKVINFIKKNYIWIILFVGIIGFITITEDVLENEIMKCDVIGYNFIKTHIISDFMTPVAKTITWFGSATCLILLCFLILVFNRNKKINIAIIFNLGICTILNLMLKNILQRPRPTEYRIIDERGYSFPSGHSMISMAFYGLLIYLIYKNIKNKYLKFTLIGLLSFLIVSIGISRIYLGVHYTSDVLAGFLVSISYLILYIGLINKLGFNKELQYEK